MRRDPYSRLVRAVHVLALAALCGNASCGQVLGLDEFEDCDAESCSGAVWAKGFGSHEFAYAESARLDSKGNILISGIFQGTVDFGGPPLISSHMAFFLAKLKPDGSHAFSRQLSVSDADGAFQPRLAVLPDDSIVLAGRYQNSIDLGDEEPLTAPTPDGRASFVARFSPDGELRWQRDLFTGTGRVSTLDAAATPDDDVVLVGSFEGEVNLGSSTLTTAAKDAFIVRLDGETGDEQWSLQLGNPEDTMTTTTIEATAVATDPDGNMIVGGRFTGSIRFGFGEGFAESPSGAGAFVLKLVPTGDRDWTSIIQGEGDAWISDIDVDARGDVLVGGALAGAIRIITPNVPGAQQTSGTPDSDLLLVKLSSAGSHLWSLKFGDDSPQIEPEDSLAVILGPRVAFDTAGEIVLGASVAGGVDFGGGMLGGRGDPDWTVAKLSARGEHLWSRRFGDPAALQVIISVDAGPETNELVVVGLNDGLLDFGSGMKIGEGGESSVVVAKIDLERVGR
ncbi:hypothetical protein [Sorangium sp. So ce131]|uniref:hypothetical protein n=1 Tax=Sorangium sp. So ce131 TaxID=3133282 RepID=UPI003F5F6DDD